MPYPVLRPFTLSLSLLFTIACNQTTPEDPSRDASGPKDMSGNATDFSVLPDTLGTRCDDDAECEDDDQCNGVWKCIEGNCEPVAPPVVCAAQDACHLPGVCAPATGICTNPVNDCDDGDACTMDDCDVSSGCVQTPKSCDDDDPETVDSCDPSTGVCEHVQQYVDNGDGTITDAATKLIWQRTPNESGFELCDMMMDYKECPDFRRRAANHCETNADGLPGVGWRLPTIGELRSLIYGCPSTAWNPVTQVGGACGVTDDCLNYWGCATDCGGCTYREGPGEEGYYLHPLFALSGHGWFWSSSASELYIDRGWSVAFYSALLNNNYIFTSFGVRCVREAP